MQSRGGEFTSKFIHQLMSKSSRILSICITALGSLNATAGVIAPIEVTWSATGEARTLRSWNQGDLKALKPQARSEKDPRSGQSVLWKGVLLQEIVDKSMEALPLEMRAQVDLLVLTGRGGAQTVMPRSVVVKYPVLIAWEKGAQPMDQVQTVAPWTTRPRILQEGLPVESYFVPELERVELTNFRERYQGLFLRRRTDPVAMRGEKLFVQNCVGCHASQLGSGLTISALTQETRARTLASQGHPPVRGGVPRLNPADRRYLVSYLAAYRGESQSSGQPIVQGQLPAASPPSPYLPRQQ